MKVIKYIGQIIAAVLFTGVFTMVFYAITVLPVQWLLSLAWWQLLLVLFFGLSIIEAVVVLLQSVISLPYAWILKGNIIATIYSTISLIGNFAWFIYLLWQTDYSGFWNFISLLIPSVILIQCGFMLVTSFIGFYCNKGE